jgi:hypothetical protein
LQIPLVFDHYTRHLACDDYGLGNQLVKWLSTDLDQSISTVLLEAIERGLTTLDGQPWESREGIRKDAFPLLLLPLAYWKITEKVTELSIRVFLRGIKFAFTQPSEENKRTGPIVIMANLEPILSKVPKSLLDKVLALGRTMEDPAIRSLCRLLSTIGYS